jgi:hypothetical protein
MKVRIKRGVKISQGDHYGLWPACKPPEHEYLNSQYTEVTKFPDAIFEAVWVEGGDQFYWECTRFGYGASNAYDINGEGFGKVLVFGRWNVELLE